MIRTKYRKKIHLRCLRAFYYNLDFVIHIAGGKHRIRHQQPAPLLHQDPRSSYDSTPPVTIIPESSTGISPASFPSVAMVFSVLGDK